GPAMALRGTMNASTATTTTRLKAFIRSSYSMSDMSAYRARDDSQKRKNFHPCYSEGPQGGRMMRYVLAFLLFIMSVAPAAAAREASMPGAIQITLARRWLDPAEPEGIITPFMVLYALHDALVKPMPAGPNTPSLAESFTQSKDGLTYEFVIRKGVK